MFSAILCSRVQDNGDCRLLNLLDSIRDKSWQFNNFEILIKFDWDDSEAYKITPEFKKYPFRINHIFDHRGRGSLDMHLGYTSLLSIANPTTSFFVTLADDFEVRQNWDMFLTESLKVFYKDHIIYEYGNEDPFFINFHSPQDYHFEYEEIENTLGLEVAPGFSKKLLYLCGGFGHTNFTDAWAVLLQRELLQQYGFNITKRTSQEYVTRLDQGVGMSILEQANRRGQRDYNFEFMCSPFYREVLKTQCKIIADQYEYRQKIIDQHINQRKGIIDK